MIDYSLAALVPYRQNIIYDTFSNSSVKPKKKHGYIVFSVVMEWNVNLGQNPIKAEVEIERCF